MYSYRSALSEDFKTIAAFPQDENELFHMFPSATFPLTAEQLETRAKERLFPTAILDGEEVAAYANLFNREGDAIWLGNVVVSPRYRGEGAGRHLIATMEKLARERAGAARLRLTCHHSNPRAMLFYTKLGYRPYEIGRTTRANGDIVALVQMEKSLTQG